MTYGNRPDYQLAEKMKSRFSGRGAAVSGMRASSTSELMRKAQMGGDPSENCSELDFRNIGANRPQKTVSDRAGLYTASAAVHTETSARVRPEEPQTQRKTASRADADNRVKKQTPRKGAQSSGGRAAAAEPKKTSGKSAEKPVKKKTAKKQRKIHNVRPQPVCAAGEITEVKVVGRNMTPMFAVGIVIGAMMFMSIVFSFSEIYQTTSEIARLEADLAVLRSQAAELELKLEEKNDIRVIEQIATDELGMVKEDAVQRKYISLSDGERIDIIEDETAENEAARGVLLSSIWSSLGSLFDYFR